MTGDNRDENMYTPSGKTQLVHIQDEGETCLHGCNKQTPTASLTGEK